MASDDSVFVISEDEVERNKEYIKRHQPYPISILDGLLFDDKRYTSDRILSTFILKQFLVAGYSEDEVNPWKKKE